MLFETCVFYNVRLDAMPVDAGILKEMYCRSDNSDCARFVAYKVLGRGAVPRDLLPPQLSRALELIA
jgi:hypothetical protein